MSDVTKILAQIERGAPAAAERLLPLVYDELKKLAATRMIGERPDHTLQATALVHEAYVRLDLDTWLCRLAEEDPEAAELLKLRLFAGLSVSEAGEWKDETTKPPESNSSITPGEHLISWGQGLFVSAAS